MTRYFRQMQIDAGIYVEVVKLEKEKRPSGKEPSTASTLFVTSAPLCGSKRTTARKRVRTYMGHASIVQTYDTYGYVFDLRDNDKEALKRIESRVMSGVGEPSKNAA